MQLTALDWALVAGVLVLSFLPALWLARRAGSSATEFFASGHAAPWWLVGVSMVATTFSTDTPNLVTNLVREGGVAANWAWWAFLLTGMTTVFFYARLWRRLGVVTDLEFYELRYSGRPARIVRAFRAVYLGAFFNVVIMATVNLAAAKIANVLLGWPIGRTLLVCGVLNVAFAATSGLWGVLVTDFVQFGVAMGGSVLTAVYAVSRPEVGGLAGLVSKLPATTLAALPDLTDAATVVPLLVVPLTVLWWATWYPGSEPGGGSYIAQRMLASRSEGDAMAGTLLFTVAHYALRPWPWILVALSSMLVFPTIDDIARALPHVDRALLGNDTAYSAMITFVPSGLLGIVVAGLASAYISTISTHLNWGTSYLVHDLYRRFIRPGAEETHYVQVGRLVTAALMIASGLFTLVLDSARGAFDLMLSVGAGTGLLYLLRWYWWRVNAWSEVTAMTSSFVIATGLALAGPDRMSLPAHVVLVGTIAITTVLWLAVTWLTAPTDEATLRSFYTLARPAGPGWARVRAAVGLPAADRLVPALVASVAACVLVYAVLFGTGAVLFGQHVTATLCGALAVGALVAVAASARRLQAA